MLTSGLRRPSGHLLVSISLVALRGGLCLPSPYQGLFCQKGEQKIGSRFGVEGHQTPVAGVVGGGAVSCVWRCWSWLRSPRSREVSVWGCESVWTPRDVCCCVGAAWEVGVELRLGGDLQFTSGVCGEWVGGWAGAMRALPVQRRDAVRDTLHLGTPAARPGWLARSCSLANEILPTTSVCCTSVYSLAHPCTCTCRRPHMYTCSHMHADIRAPIHTFPHMM